MGNYRRVLSRQLVKSYLYFKTDVLYLMSVWKNDGGEIGLDIGKLIKRLL